MRVLFIYRNPGLGYSIGKIYKPVEEEMKKYADVDCVYLPVANYKPAGFVKNIRAARAAVNKKHYDIVHITGAEHYLLPFLKGQRTVITVHDLGFYTNAKFGLRKIWKYCLWIKTLRYADVVTFISEKSQREAERFVRFKPGQAVTVRNAVAPDYKYTPKEINTARPTVLHIGTKQKKNLANTIRALKDFPCRLRVIGPIDAECQALLDTCHIDYTNACDLTNEQIVKEYENCDIVNFPSLYEGFGQIIIEAQAVGRPVVTSDLSPMKEVAGDGAVLVNPHDPQSILEGYKCVIADPQKYITAGYENVKKYTVENITKEFYNVYCKIKR